MNVNVLTMNEAVRADGFALRQIDDRRAKFCFFFVWLFTVNIYARPEDIVPFLGPLHLTYVFGLCAGVAYVGAFLLGRAGLLWPRELCLVAFLTGWYITGVPFALWRGGSFEVLTQVWFKTLLIFFLLTQTLVTLERIRKLLWAIILSELFVTSYSIAQSPKVIWVGERMLGINLGILGWNFLGIAIALTIPYIAALFISDSSLLKRSLLVAAVLSMTWMLVLTASRSGFLNVMFSIVLTSLLVLRGNAGGKVVGLLIILLLVIALSFAPNVFWQRIGTIWSTSDSGKNQITASAEESQEDRVAVLTRSIQYTLERPLWGLGLGNFVVAGGTRLGRSDAWMGTHNTFTQISSEAGVPALLLFITLFAVALRNMKTTWKAAVNTPQGAEMNLMARATWVSLLSLIFGSLFAHIAYEYFLFYPVAIAAGIAHVARTTQPTWPQGRAISLQDC